MSEQYHCTNSCGSSRRTLTNILVQPVKTTHDPTSGPARDKSPVTSGRLQNNECGRMVGKGQSLAGIGFRGSSLVSVRPVKYVHEYERPSICRLSVPPCSTLDSGHRGTSAFSRPPATTPTRTGCSPFLSRSNLTRMPAMHTYETICTDLLVVDRLPTARNFRSLRCDWPGEGGRWSASFWQNLSAEAVPWKLCSGILGVVGSENLILG